MAPCMMYSYRKIEDRFTRDTATRLVALRYQIPRDVRYMLRQLCRLHSRRGERKIPGGQPYDRPRCTISHMTMREQMPCPYKNCVHATPPADYDMTEEEVEAVVLAN